MIRRVRFFACPAGGTAVARGTEGTKRAERRDKSGCGRPTEGLEGEEVSIGRLAEG